jgi:hypothetical protein
VIHSSGIPDLFGFECGPENRFCTNNTREF